MKEEVGIFFQASSGGDSSANSLIPIRATESKFDLNTYKADSRFILGALASIFMDQVKTG